VDYNGGVIAKTTLRFPPETLAHCSSSSDTKVPPTDSKLVFDTSQPYFFYWIAVVSTAYTYNLMVAIARIVFVDLAVGQLWLMWLVLDAVADFIYLLDMLFRSRTGFLEQGLLVKDVTKTRALYLKVAIPELSDVNSDGYGNCSEPPVQARPRQPFPHGLFAWRSAQEATARPPPEPPSSQGPCTEVHGADRNAQLDAECIPRRGGRLVYCGQLLSIRLLCLYIHMHSMQPAQLR